MSAIAAEHTFTELLERGNEPLCELVRGAFVDKPMAFLSLLIASRICRFLSEQLEDARLGWPATEVPINCFDWIPNHGRRPDVAFFSRELFRDGIPTNAPITVAPELCVEVISPGDNASDLDEKLEEYLRAGVRLVWFVYPETRTLKAFREDGSSDRFEADELIENEPALPGFKARVADFFPKNPND